MRVNIIVHVIHVAGTRMKEPGIYGLSSGDFLGGFIGRKDTLGFLTLDLGALERSDGLEHRMRDFGESFNDEVGS